MICKHCNSQILDDSLFCNICGNKIIENDSVTNENCCTFDINKQLDKDTSQVVFAGGTNIEPLLKRILIFLEDKNWTSADAYCEKVLDIEPENVMAYLGKLMAELHVSEEEELRNNSTPLDSMINYQKALKYADSCYKKKLEGYNNLIINRIEEDRLSEIYSKGKKLYDNHKYDESMNILKNIPYYRDSNMIVEECEKRIQLKQLKKELRKEKIKKVFIALLIIFSIIKSIDIFLISAIKYNKAVSLLESGNKDEAFNILYDLKGYKDSAIKLRSFYEKNSTTIGTGNLHTVGLKKDGTLEAYGDNKYGQCNVSNWRDMAAVSAGENHTVGLSKNGTVVAVGDNEYDQCSVSGWKDIVAISAGNQHTVGLKSDGTVVAVGRNRVGECDVYDLKEIVAISAGGNNTTVLKKDGKTVISGAIWLDYSYDILKKRGIL